jgi:ABC-2 type transport system ATP-binding protein
MIVVNGISKNFRDQQVLKKVSVDFPAGEITGIVGRNGSGKTVLLKCIIGLLKPDHGEIIVQGKRIGKDVDFAENVGFIVNRPGFLKEMSGFRNLKYLASIRGRIGDTEIREALDMVGLGFVGRKPVGKYSMGMVQRLGIAQALMEKPSILIFDEPMNGLDNNAVSEIRTLFLKLRKQGKTIIITSHNHEDIDILCNGAYEMDQGVLTVCTFAQTSKEL